MICLPLAVILLSFLQMTETWFSREPNKVAFSTPFLRLGLCGGMRPTNQPQRVFMPHCWEMPSPFSVFLGGKGQPPNSPKVTEIRYLEAPLDATFTSQGTAEGLRIRKDDCFSFCAGLARIYRKQRLFQRTVPWCGHT